MTTQDRADCGHGVFQQGYGLAVPWQSASKTRRTLALPILLQGLTVIQELRKFFDVHGGRQIPFWLPSWVNDLDVQTDASQGLPPSPLRATATHNSMPWGCNRFVTVATRDKLECYGVTGVAPSGANDVLTLSRGLTRR
jgi:hypothetical protein